MTTDKTLGSISGPTLGGISVSLGSAHSGRASSGGSSGSSDRNNQLVSLNLIDFIEPEVGDYETGPLTRTDEVTISDHVYEHKEWYESLVEGLASVGATIVVGATSVISGALDVVENVVDGAACLAAAAVDLVGLDDAADSIRGFVKEDLVGDLNDALYADGGLLEGVNDASYLKYDSEEMQGLRDLSKKATEFAAATALTICTGGLATAGVGFLSGLGEGAEDAYQKYGYDLTLLQRGLIALQGIGGAFSWYSQGKLGKGLLEIGKTINLVGFKDVLTQMKKEVFNKDFLKSLFSKSNVIGNTFASIMQSSGDITKIITKLQNGEEVTTDEILQLGGELLLYFGLNTLEDAGRTYVSNFKVSTETAELIAARLADSTDDLKLEDITCFGEETINKILTKMDPKDIALNLEKVDMDTYKKIMNSLSKEDKLKVIYAQAELVAQGKYSAFFMNFREHAELHTNEVRDYAVALASKIDGIDVDEVYYGAQFHDLGMRGGVFEMDGKFVPIDSVTIDSLSTDDIEKYIVDSHGWGGLSADELDAKMFEEYGVLEWSSIRDKSVLPDEIIAMAYSDKLANLARKNHPLNSAIAILTEDVTPEGVDKNVVALLAMSHSKSTSGIRHFDDPEEWRSCIDKLGYALGETGMDPEDVAKITQPLYDTIDDPDTFTRLVDEALCIRDGDAMSKVPLVHGDTLMQNGEVSHVELSGKAKLSDDFSEVPTTPDAENAGITDTLSDIDGNPTGRVDNAFSKKTHAGELNVTFDSDYDGYDYIASATVTDPTKTPFASLDSTWERIEEVATYSNCGERTFEVVLPKNMEGTELGKWYVEEMAARMTKHATKAGSDSQLKSFYETGIKVVFR